MRFPLGPRVRVHVHAAQLALLAFDEGQTPEPFSFLLKNAHVTRAGTGGDRRKSGTRKTKPHAKDNADPNQSVLSVPKS